MNTKLFLLTLCLGTATAPAKMYTPRPFHVLNALLAAGQTVSHVTISTAKL